MFSVLLHSSHDLQRLLRQSAVQPIEEQFGKAEYAVQRRPQLVAHIGKKLALVFIGDGKLASFLLYLAKQARVVHRENRLIGKSAHQADRALRKISDAPALQNQSSQSFLRSDQRGEKAGKEPPPKL